MNGLCSIIIECYNKKLYFFQSPFRILLELDENIASNWDLYLITILTLVLGLVIYMRRPHQDPPVAAAQAPPPPPPPNPQENIIPSPVFPDIVPEQQPPQTPDDASDTHSIVKPTEPDNSQPSTSTLTITSTTTATETENQPNRPQTPTL